MVSLNSWLMYLSATSSIWPLGSCTCVLPSAWQPFGSVTSRTDGSDEYRIVLPPLVKLEWYAQKKLSAHVVLSKHTFVSGGVTTK